MPDGSLGSRYASASQSPGLALWHVTNRWQAVMRAALAPHDLTHVQYVLLANLVWLHSREPGRQSTQAALAELTATDVMMASQVLRALEAKGLVERARHPSDGRARILHATPLGIQAARAATVDVEAADASFFGQLPDLGAFADALTLLR